MSERMHTYTMVELTLPPCFFLSLQRVAAQTAPVAQTCERAAVSKGGSRIKEAAAMPQYIYMCLKV